MCLLYVWRLPWKQSMQTPPLFALHSVTYHSRCRWSEPGSWKIWTGWCRCVGASPPCPRLCASYWHQHEWAHGKNGYLCPRCVSWELWRDRTNDFNKYTFNLKRLPLITDQSRRWWGLMSFPWRYYDILKWNVELLILQDPKNHFIHGDRLLEVGHK